MDGKATKEESSKGTRMEREDETSIGILPSSVLLIDGYNVCGKWRKLQKRVLSGDLEGARDMLEGELAVYGSLRGMRIVLFWDAFHSGRKTDTRVESVPGLEVVYCGTGTADEFIETEVYRLREAGIGEVWVATSDRQQQNLTGGNGALILSSGRLISDIKKVKAHADIDLEDQMQIQRMHGQKLVGDAIDEGARDALFSLRNALSRRKS